MAAERIRMPLLSLIRPAVPMLLLIAAEIVETLPPALRPFGTTIVRVVPFRSIPLEKVMTPALVVPASPRTNLPGLK